MGNHDREPAKEDQINETKCRFRDTSKDEQRNYANHFSVGSSAFADRDATDVCSAHGDGHAQYLDERNTYADTRRRSKRGCARRPDLCGRGIKRPRLVSDMQIYDPATDSWRTGVPLPTPLADAATALVNDVLYVIGGDDSAGGSPPTNTVWAYCPGTKTWSAKTPMPTARNVAVAVVENKIICVIGGWNGILSGPGLATVESYDPATDTWTERSQLLVGKWAPSGGLFGTKARLFRNFDAVCIKQVSAKIF